MKHCSRLPKELLDFPSLEIQNLTGLNTGQPALADPVWSGGVGPDDHQKCNPTAAIIWFYEHKQVESDSKFYSSGPHMTLNKADSICFPQK